ncbi:hypothetical protein KFK09_010012 [Dendrobium nobile]|uniref:Myosin motor domain-containing protein n=1 Tax=Dendrobium nobile TaxID=94219 RepID=A0A8T3BJE9_DENNO|nr:hypothetical protein KFK09_010012 [Dendrobium nobile]
MTKLAYLHEPGVLHNLDMNEIYDIERYKLANPTDSSTPKRKKSWFHLQTAANLLMCDENAVEKALCERIIVTRVENITKTLDPEAAVLSRDALAKVIYSRLFYC